MLPTTDAVPIDDTRIAATLERQRLASEEAREFAVREGQLRAIGREGQRPDFAQMPLQGGERLHQRVIGQDEAVTAVAEAVRRGWAGEVEKGIEALQSALPAKRLELMKEMLPSISRVAFMQNMGNPVSAPQWDASQAVAASRITTGFQIWRARFTEVDATLRHVEASAAARE